MKVELLVGLIAIGVIGAVFIPLAFDTQTGAFNNAICHIFLFSGGQLDCDQPDDTFNFLAGAGIQLTAIDNKTLFINATSVPLGSLNRTDVIAISQFDNFDWAGASDYVTKSSNSPSSAVEAFDNYRLAVLRYKDANPSGVDAAHWTNAIPVAFDNSSATIDLDLYWYRDTVGNDAPHCWGVSLFGWSEFDMLNIVYPPAKIKCIINQNATDVLYIENFQFNNTEHNVFGQDFVSVQVTREIDNPTDTFNREVNFLGTRIIWEK